jgi:hypothetical protein
MRTLLPSLVLGVLILCSTASAQIANHGIMDTPGATSTDNWVVVLQTNELGLIFNWDRIKGREPRQSGDCMRTLLTSEPGWKADTVLTGTSKIGTWTIKMNLDSALGIPRVWGQDATGAYWVGTLVVRKITADEPRRNRRTPARSIY